MTDDDPNSGKPTGTPGDFVPRRQETDPGFAAGENAPPPYDDQAEGYAPAYYAEEPEPERPARKGWRRYLVYSGLGAAGIAAAVFLAGVVYLYVILKDLPSVQTLENYAPPVTTRVYAGDGTLIGEYARERRIFVPITFVPKLVVYAFTSAEDRNFFRHSGIDPSGIARAAIKDVFLIIQGRRLEGASTITQQVAKNFLLNSEVKISRKIREAILAVRIDATYTKDKILELYLNQIYLGANSYGVAAAALNYFDKSLDQLTIAEVAFLAALPKAPSNYDPNRRKQAAVDRRNWVIGQMEENGYITAEEAAAAKAEPLVTRAPAPMGSQTQDVDYFVEEVRRLLYAKYGEKGLYDGGLQVRSTLDTRLQDYAVNALRAGLVRYDRRHGWRGAVSNIDVSGNWKGLIGSAENQSGVPTWRVAVVLGIDGNTTRVGLANGQEGIIPFSELTWARRGLKNGAVGPGVTRPEDVVKTGDVIYVEALENAGQYGLRQVPEVNGAIVALDPHTGRVLAMSGGFSFASSQYDRAMQAKRQPGSTFKPFVYAAALEDGYTPQTKVEDGPFSINQGAGLGMWSPKNFSKTFLGPIPLRRGLELSRNLVTVRLASQIGMNRVSNLVERFGVYERLPRFLANSLGAYETTLLNVATGYAEFVNGGKKITPSLIDRIQDRNGKTIWRHDQRPCEGCNDPNWHGQSEPLLPDVRKQVIDQVVAYQVVSMLEGVVQRGTGTSVKVVGKPVGGKTGTSNDAKDVWFVGFSPDLVAGAYVGFDNPRTLGHNEQGAITAAPIFRDFMKGALEDALPTPFRVPVGAILVPTPVGSSIINEAYRPGTEPGAYVAPPPVTSDAAAPTGSASDVGEGTGGLY